MDRIQIITNIKNIITELILNNPKTIEIHRDKNEIIFSLSYPYGYKYKEYYKEEMFSRIGAVIIDLDNIVENYNYIRMELIKVKKFLKNRNKKN